MTGNKWRCPALILTVLAFLFLTLPAYAQNTVIPSAAEPSLSDETNYGLPPGVTLNFRTFTLAPDRFSFENVLLNYGGELTIRADQVFGTHPPGGPTPGIPDLQSYTAIGHVMAHDADTTLTSTSLQFDGPKNLGTAEQARLVQKPYTIRAQQIEVTPAAVVAAHASFTTAPPDVSPDYEIRVQTITLDPKRRRGEMRHAALYLFHTHLITIPRWTFALGAGNSTAARRQSVVPAFGTSSRYGAFVAIEGGVGHPIPLHFNVLLPSRQSVQLRLASDQPILPRRSKRNIAAAERTAQPPASPLAALRALATASRGPLPEGDPLLFHDYLPDPNPIRLFDSPAQGGLSIGEELSFHLQASGRRRDDLYVTRLPELSLNGLLPLTSVPGALPQGDAAAFRRSLRRIALYLGAQETYGDYREQPTNIHANRERRIATLFTRPLLIAPNTVILPRLALTTSHYSNAKDSYRFGQFAIALNHYFSDRSAIGLQFLGSDVRGDSPFNFDVLDTSRELDTRLQLGDRHLTAAGVVRYDLTARDVIDYKTALAFGLRGFTPVLSYDFQNRSVGLGVEVEGVTF